MKAFGLLVGSAVLLVVMMVAISMAAASAGRLPWHWAVLLFAAGGAGIVALYRIDKRRVAHETQAKKEEIDGRYDKLARVATSGVFRLEVKAPSGLLAGLAMAAVGALLVDVPLADGRIVALALGILMLVLGAPMLAHGILALGKPALVLDSVGLETALLPLINWERVEGIHLRTNYHKGRVVSHSLFFHVPGIEEVLDSLSPLRRALYRLRSLSGRRKLHVLLRRSSEPPEVLYRLARTLWNARTGRDYLWDPSAPESLNEAFRQDAEILEQLKRLKPNPNSLPELERLTEAATRNGEVIRQELQRKLKRTLRQARWTGAGLLIAFFFWLAAKLSGVLA